VIANPNAGADTKTGAPTHTVKEWFNVNAFALAPGFSAAKNGQPATQGQFGNSGRNTVIGPRYTDIDLTLSRSFPIYERLAGQFRGDVFNVLNHPNFFNPLTQGAQFGSGAAFGSVTQAYDNREFQFSLRLSF
jgi:hypothetical protein